MRACVRARVRESRVSVSERVRELRERVGACVRMKAQQVKPAEKKTGTT